jgi:beta-N-acetylhexosaminidase
MTDNSSTHAGGIADPHLMLAFDSSTVPDWLSGRLGNAQIAGLSLFREWNLKSPDQTAELTERLQRENSGPHQLLIAADQEGGQLLSIVGSTPFAGNMAIGATGDTDLAQRVGRAIGHEMASVGFNVNYAPAVDVASAPGNPSLGIRSFGDDPEAVSRMAAATVTGMNDGGVLASAKHFPGKGEAIVDPHYDLPVLNMDFARLSAVEIPPFVAAFSAGAQFLMTGHYVVPAITGSREVPISASAKGITGFARGELDFGGIVITDALDMGALDQGPAQVVEIIAMMEAGTDLLLCMPDLDLQDRVRSAVERGFSRGLINESTLQSSRARITRVRQTLPDPELDPAVLSNSTHMDLARELATRSVTLVRNDAGLLPLRVDQDERILVLEPTPTDITPADTTSFYPAALGAAIRDHHLNVKEIVYPHSPGPLEIAALMDEANDADLIIVGTVFSGSEQADLVTGLSSLNTPIVAVALRTPFDLAKYPKIATYACTYSSHEPSVQALAAALFGKAGFEGHLPAAIPGLFATGHGLT